jgi:hypothetical protein
VTIIVDDFQSSVERNRQIVQKTPYQQDRTLRNDRGFEEDNAKGKGLWEEMGKTMSKAGGYEPFGTSFPSAGTLFARVLLVWK